MAKQKATEEPVKGEGSEDEGEKPLVISPLAEALAEASDPGRKLLPEERAYEKMKTDIGIASGEIDVWGEPFSEEVATQRRQYQQFLRDERDAERHLKRYTDSSLNAGGTWGRDILSGIASGGARNLAMVTGLVGLLDPAMEKRSRELYRKSRVLALMSDKALELEGASERERYWRGMLRTVAESFTSMMLSGTHPIAVFSLTEGHQAYLEGKDVGMSEGDAALYGLRAGTIEAVPALIMQKIGLGGIEKMVTNPASKLTIKRFFFMLLQEIPEEIVTEVGHALHRHYTYDQLSNMTMEELWTIMRDTTIATIGQTTLMAGAGRLGRTHALRQLVRHYKEGGQLDKSSLQILKEEGLIDEAGVLDEDAFTALMTKSDKINPHGYRWNVMVDSEGRTVYSLDGKPEVATVQQNKQGVWVATVGGQIIAGMQDKKLLLRTIENMIQDPNNSEEADAETILSEQGDQLMDEAAVEVADETAAQVVAEQEAAKESVIAAQESLTEDAEGLTDEEMDALDEEAVYERLREQGWNERQIEAMEEEDVDNIVRYGLTPEQTQEAQEAEEEDRGEDEERETGEAPVQQEQPTEPGAAEAAGEGDQIGRGKDQGRQVEAGQEAAPVTKPKAARGKGPKGRKGDAKRVGDIVRAKQEARRIAMDKNLTPEQQRKELGRRAYQLAELEARAMTSQEKEALQTRFKDEIHKIMPKARVIADPKTGAVYLASGKPGGLHTRVRRGNEIDQKRAELAAEKLGVKTGGKVAGFFDPTNNEIVIFSDDPSEFAVSHEAIHFFKKTGVITESEWKQLVEQAKAATLEGRNLEAVLRGEKEGQEGKYIDDEELVAYFVQNMFQGRIKQPRTTVLQKIWNFIRSLGGLIGIKPSSTQTVEALMRGEMIERRPGRDTLAWLQGATNKDVREALRLMVAFHGTPHLFDRFSLAHIGRGQGAQSFGWGLYFTNSRDIAEWYRDNLTRGGQATGTVIFKNYEGYLEDSIGWSPADLAELEGESREELDRYLAKVMAERAGWEANMGRSVTADGLISAMEEQLSKMRNQIVMVSEGALLRHDRARIAKPKDVKEMEAAQEDMDAMEEAMDVWKRLEISLAGTVPSDITLDIEYGTEGKVYEVDIPESTDLLQWDKLMSEQPESVQEMMRKLPNSIWTAIEEMGDERNETWARDTITGEQFYKLLAKSEVGAMLPAVPGVDMYASSYRSDQHASMYLNSLGIPGLEFPAGSLSGMQKGERNYVIWNDEAVSMMKIGENLDDNIKLAVSHDHVEWARRITGFGETSEQVHAGIMSFAAMDRMLDRAFKKAPKGWTTRRNATAYDELFARHPDLKQLVMDLQRYIEKKTGWTVNILDADGNFVKSPIEMRKHKGSLSQQNKPADATRPQFGGFQRSLTQSFMEQIPDSAFEAFRSDIMRAVEDAYMKEQLKDDTGVEFVYTVIDPKTGDEKTARVKASDLLNLPTKPLKTIQAEIAKVSNAKRPLAPGGKLIVPVKKADKTLAALNLDTMCPMFQMGANGCYMDGCYVTQMGAAGSGFNFYSKAMYSGEILMWSQRVIDALNNVGGLRMNGMGDTSMDQLPQWRDALRHAKMRGLKVKVITKQPATFQILQKLSEEGMDISDVLVQPTIDPYWVPVTEDDMPKSGVRELGLAKYAGTDKSELVSEVKRLYKEEFGREAKMIDGTLHRKWGFSVAQVEELMAQNPAVNVRPRVVVSTAKEICEMALRFPQAIQTWMHAKIRPGMYSSIEGKTLTQKDTLNFDARIGFRKSGNRWTILAQAKKGKGLTAAQAAKEALVAESRGRIDEAARLKGLAEELARNPKQVPITQKKAFRTLEDYIYNNYGEDTGNHIIEVLMGQTDVNPGALCCTDGASKDACADCTSHCHDHKSIDNMDADEGLRLAVQHDLSSTSGLTAQARTEPSVGVKDALKRGLVKGRVLHMGSGQGVNADSQELGVLQDITGLTNYDPNHRPQTVGKLNKQDFDTVVSPFVAHTLTPQLRDQLYADIATSLAPDGVAHITVPGVMPPGGVLFEDGIMKALDDGKVVFQRGYTPAELEAELGRFFDDVKVHKIGTDVVAEARGPKTLDDDIRLATMDRPNFANPAIDPAVRATIDDMVAARMELGLGVEKGTFAQWEQEARDTFEEIGEEASVKKILNAVRKGNARPLSPQEVGLAQILIRVVGRKAVTTGDPGLIDQLAEINNAYRDKATQAGQTLAMYRDRVRGPEARMRLFNESLLLYPDDIRLSIEQAKKRGDQKLIDSLEKEYRRHLERLFSVLRHHGYDPADLSLPDKLTDDPFIVEGLRIMAEHRNSLVNNFGRMITEYWINSILSGPKTHIVNITGNAAMLGLEFFLNRTVQAALNSVPGLRNEDGVTWTELGHLWKGFFKSIFTGQAWRNMRDSWRMESDAFEMQILGDKAVRQRLEDIPGAIPDKAGGRFIRIPGRALVAMDSWFKTVITMSEVSAIAYKDAKKQGLEGEDISAYMHSQMEDTSSPVWLEALDTARELTFQQDLGPLGSVAQRARAWSIPQLGNIQPLAFLIPFTRTPMNIFKLGVRKSPIGSIGLAAELISKGLYGLLGLRYPRAAAIAKGIGMRNEPDLPHRDYRARFNKLFAEQLMAWGALLGILTMMSGDDEDDRPVITGTRSSDWGKRNHQYRVAPPTSIRIGNYWYDYGRLEPFATTIAGIVDGIEIFEQKKGTLPDKAFATMMAAMAQSKDKTFLQGLGDLGRAVEEAQRIMETGEFDMDGFVGRWGIRFTSSWMPNVVRQPLRESQEFIHEQTRRAMEKGESDRARRWRDIYRQALPLEMIQAPPKVGPWGRRPLRHPKSRTTWWSRMLWGMVSPVNVREAFDAEHIGSRIDYMLMRYAEKVKHMDQSHIAEAKDRERPYYPRPPADTYKFEGENYTFTEDEYERFSELAAQETIKALEEAEQRLVDELKGGYRLNFRNPTREDINNLKKARRKGVDRAKDLFLEERQGLDSSEEGEGGKDVYEFFSP